MKIFLAGAAGAIGRRLVPLLLRAGHSVTGTTRSPQRGEELAQVGATPLLVDVFDAKPLRDAVVASAPDVVIHQLTDLPRELDETRLAAAYAANARIRIEGTRNLVAAALAAGTTRFVLQSIAFGYAPGGEPHPETHPLNLSDPARAVTIGAAAAMEEMVLTDFVAAIVLRYGLFYGPGTWSDRPVRKPSLHIDAAAQAALLALSCGLPGIYNIADDDGIVAIDKARRDLGFDPEFRIPQ
ncbi:MAG: NAD-dependent epimerase/dehydratase family protein [Xanthobacteraceae bacterium]